MDELDRHTRGDGSATTAPRGRSARPAVIQVLDDPLATAPFSDAILAAQTGQNNADLPCLRRRSTSFHLA